MAGAGWVVWCGRQAKVCDEPSGKYLCTVNSIVPGNLAESAEQNIVVRFGSGGELMHPIGSF